MNAPWTQLPNELCDVWMKDWSDAALRVFICVCRKTIGFHKDTDAISLSQLVSMTGLSLNGVRKGVSDLLKLNKLRIDRQGRGRGTATFYTLNLDNSAVTEPIKENIGAATEPLILNNGAATEPTKERESKEKEKESSAVAQRFVTDGFEKRFERESGGEKYPWSPKDFAALKRSKILLAYSEEKIDLCVEAYFYDRSLWFNKNGGGRSFTQMITHWGELLTSSVVRRGSEKVIRIVSDGNGGTKQIMAPRLFVDEA